ncbi:hypothetical protein ACKRZS_004348 [Fusarium odoratissimum]
MGPVGCGKSTLLYGHLNAIRYNSGQVWDLDHLSGRDMHEVGNKGSSLSGGQRQRIALARAVYAQNPILFLVNPLSGVDHTTSKHIVQALFRDGGLLRSGNITVLITTDSREVIAHGAIVRIKDCSRDTPVANGCGHEVQAGYEGGHSIVFKDVTVAYAQPKPSSEDTEDRLEETGALN